MSENLDLVRSIYAAWERGDYGSAAWADPDVEFRFVGGPEPGRGVGAAEMAERFRTFLAAWNDWRVYPEDLRELDDGRVVAFVRFETRGKTSGIDFGLTMARAANLFQITSAKVSAFVSYWDRDRAIADLGLTQ